MHEFAILDQELDLDVLYCTLFLSLCVSNFEIYV
jgi:hypothetical protein